MAADLRKVQSELVRLGYMDEPVRLVNEKNLQSGLKLFQKNHGRVFEEGGVNVHGRKCDVDGKLGPVTEKLLFMPRTCGAPDIARTQEGGIIEKARWPPSCSNKLVVTTKFDKAPGLTKEQTIQGIVIAIAEWNIAFQSPQNGQMYDKYVEEIRRMLPDNNEVLRNFILWVGTFKHEVGHALGLSHTPNDPDSVMYPSMRGQWLLNATDINNLSRNGYKKGNITLEYGKWNGSKGSEIWATLQALVGPTLAWSFLSYGDCRQRAEQAYDNTVSWNSGGSIIIPPLDKPDPPDPPDPPTPQPPFLDRLHTTEYKDKDGKLIGKTKNIKLDF